MQQEYIINPIYSLQGLAQNQTGVILLNGNFTGTLAVNGIFDIDDHKTDGDVDFLYKGTLTLEGGVNDASDDGRNVFFSGKSTNNENILDIIQINDTDTVYNTEAVFKTIESVGTIFGGVNQNYSFGISGQGISRVIPVDHEKNPRFGYVANVTGDITYKINKTLDSLTNTNIKDPRTTLYTTAENAIATNQDSMNSFEDTLSGFLIEITNTGVLQNGDNLKVVFTHE